LKKYFTEDKVS